MATQSRLPTGEQGGFDNWTAVGEADTWDCCDDPIGTPDDDTTYADYWTDVTHLFTFTAFDITSTSVTKLTITSRVREEGADWDYQNESDELMVSGK